MAEDGSKGRSGGPKRKAPTKRELQDHVAQLEKELKEKEKRAEELLNSLAYAQAELENLRKQVDREREQIVRYASESLIRKLLPVVDNFELALNSIRDSDDDFVSGVRMIYQNLVRVLQSEGLQEIKAEGEMFDPFLHEAVEYVEEDGDGRIVKVLQKGYRLEDRILRPSQVVVSKKGGGSDG